MPTYRAHFRGPLDVPPGACACLAALLLLPVAASVHAEPLLLAQFLSFDTGSVPHSVAIADVDADGRLDLAVANSGSHTVTVLLGNGDGTFGSRADFGAGSYPRSVAIADLNADGQADLAVANSGSHTVTVLIGNGDGTFGATSDYDTGMDPYSVAIADLNADGRPDLAVANYSSHT
ncbi:MAG: FG-GAP repeat domain-containing protein, partial [Candidatus Eiseniibacteriota bacterium]